MKAIYWDEANQGMTFEERDIALTCWKNVKNGMSIWLKLLLKPLKNSWINILKLASLIEEEIKKGLRIRTLKNEIIPMLCGSAFKNKGVQAMLDAVIEYLPSPADVPAVKGHLNDAAETASRTTSK